MRIPMRPLGLVWTAPTSIQARRVRAGATRGIGAEKKNGSASVTCTPFSVWSAIFLLTWAVLDHLVYLLLHRIQVEGRRVLHRRIVDRRLRQLGDVLLHHDEAPELAGEEVVHVAAAQVVEGFAAD